MKFLWKKTDANGYTQPKSLEFFSSTASSDISVTDGDTHWTMIDCALSSPITGGPWFGAPTTGPVFDYSDPVPWTNTEQEPTTTSPPPTPGTVPETETQIPVQILQVAWELHR